ncbi:retropepsin-like domain-containing protein [Crocosphaera sp. XPORK-15E]|uniref:retropepsin-like domain-containing protein n=1 Tax=Crocosphaera sp. XPORK-15E TaxID=3110247 RepID=UPI002B204923|nr:retropepsin-like domain-containing protein [Crocosphaera sp. XPORK-15E]MEA5534450.1 retropepsin-like domain-containing protein [Crocosphaera sp. XPORK-15E]
MSNSPSKEQAEKIIKWLNTNRHMVLDLYKNQYIAYNEEGIISHGENLQDVLDLANTSGKNYLIYVVPPHRCSIQILPIHFRSVVRHDWQPNYSVKLRHHDRAIEVTMLVDSGAEISLLSLKVGQDLGLNLADAESTLLAETIGGRVEYVLRNLEITIDKHTFIAPVAWLQNPTESEQLLLGREVVFDKFNIEFRQAEEKIIFTWLT